MSKLSECVNILDSKRIPLSSKARANLKKIYPYYGAQGIVDYVEDYLFDGNYILVAEDGNNLKSLSEPIATWATGKFWVNNHAHILGEKSGYSLKYIYYLLNCMDLRGYITGSAQPKFTQENLANIDINLPNIEMQNAIATVLSVLDGKIINNKAVWAELESMAKTLYDYWFTQFDFPDENGKPYRTSGGEMVWNDQLKREIPKGWGVRPMSSVISSINTGLNPRDNFMLGKGNIQYLTVKNLTTAGTVNFSGCDTIDEEARDIIHRRSDISVGDILFASIAPLGRCYLIQNPPENWDINESVFSIRGNSKCITPEFLYMYFMSDTFIKGATSSSTGSIFKGIRINTLLDMVAVIPPKSVTELFSAQIRDMLALKAQKSEENMELTKLRDWLLPMLMNGQATVAD